MERVIEWNGHATWCSIEGDLDATGPAPVVLLHGGPGLPSDYLSPLMRLGTGGRAVVRYDQLGCGNSVIEDEADSLWTLDTFVDELSAVIRQLGIDRYFLWGHSWGGWLALEYTIKRRPPGLVGLVLASTCASIPRFGETTRTLKEQLTPEVQAIIDAHEAAGTTESAEYFEAFMEYAKRWLIRTELPDHLMASVARKNEHIYQVMQGPEWNVIGNLRDWDVTERLTEIQVPVLVTSGRHDEMTPELVGPMVAALDDAEWVIFEKSAHMAFIEEESHYIETLSDFLDHVDARVSAR